MIDRVLVLENGIRKVAEDWVRGDDKCWMDLIELFQLLPEEFRLPEQDTAVELKYCEQYIRSCHHPDVKYISPQRRIEELEAIVRQGDRLLERCNKIIDSPQLKHLIYNHTQRGE